MEIKNKAGELVIAWQSEGLSRSYLLRRYMETGNKSKLLGYVNPRKRKTSTIDLDFSIEPHDLRCIDKYKKEGIDRGFAVLSAPFTGDFRFLVDGEDIMPAEIRDTRGNYPFAYAEWLMENSREYTKPLGWRGRKNHVFVDYLGSSSPEILLYGEGESQIIVPTLTDQDPVFVESRVFSEAVKKLCLKAATILERNPVFSDSEFLKKLREVESENSA